MIAMRFMFICLDEYLAYLFFSELHRDIHVMADRVFAVVNYVALDAAQYAVVEMESFFCQCMFQSFKGVVFQIVSDAQRVRDVAILDLAVWQPG